MAIDVSADAIAIAIAPTYVKFFSTEGQIELGTVSLTNIVITHYPGAERNPDLDQVIDLSYVGIDSDGITDTYPFIPTLTITVHGDWYDKCVVADPITITLTIPTTFVEGGNWDGGAIEIALSLGSPEISLVAIGSNWIKWSNIGSLDFTVWKDNVAGERPLDWGGWIYVIKKLMNKVAVYGENGVSLLTPVNNLWGLATISRIGLKTRASICGNDFVHYYIDVEGRLCKVDDTIEVLGYNEFLGAMADSLVMTYNEKDQLIYICDGEIGYVYSARNKSLGQGPCNITGYGYKSRVEYIAAADTVTDLVFEITTDIYDLGNRKNKTIWSIELGANLSNAIYAAIDYRLDKTADFASTPWVRVNPNGVTPIPCFGVEFKFKFKMYVYEQFEVDYLRVNGIIHNSSYLDVFSREGR